MLLSKQNLWGEPPGLVVNAEDSRSEPPWFESQLHQKNLDGNDGPLDGIKTNENDKDHGGKSRQKKIKKKKKQNLWIKTY